MPPGVARRRRPAAEPRSFKLATVSPDGTLWSRELRATAQEIEAGTDGAVRIKLYLGAVAGDETEVAARLAKGQLDAVASAGVLCDQVSPTLRAISHPGPVHDARRRRRRSRRSCGRRWTTRRRRSGFALARRDDARAGRVVHAHAGAHVRRIARGQAVALGRRRRRHRDDARHGPQRRADAGARGAGGDGGGPPRRLHGHPDGGAGLPVVDAHPLSDELARRAT